MEFAALIENLDVGSGVALTGDEGTVQVERLVEGYSLTGEWINFQDFSHPWDRFAHCLYYNSEVGPSLRLVVAFGESVARPQVFVPAIDGFGRAGQRLRQFVRDLLAPNIDPVSAEQTDVGVALEPDEEQVRDFAPKIQEFLASSHALTRRIVPAISPPGVLLDFEDWLVHLFPGSREYDVDVLIPITAIEADDDPEGFHLRDILALNNMAVIGHEAVLEVDDDLDVVFLSCGLSWEKLLKDIELAVFACLGLAIEIERRLQGESSNDFADPVTPDVESLAFFYMNRV